MTIPEKSIKKLYALSAGRCNICKLQLFENDVHVGEMAHVIAKKKTGPRGDEKIENCNSYENLILLCANHHTEVDQNPLKYTTEKLHQLKRAHESYVTESLQRPDTRKNDIDSLNIIMRNCPFTRIYSHLQYLPESFNTDFFKLGETVDAFCIHYPHRIPFSDPILENAFKRLMNDYSSLSGLLLKLHKGIAIYNSTATNLKTALLERELPYEDKILLKRKINSVASKFTESYRSFIEFIKLSYPEVNLGAYSA